MTATNYMKDMRTLLLLYPRSMFWRTDLVTVIYSGLIRYYFKEGSDPRKLLIFLQGGGPSLLASMRRIVATF